MSTNDVPGAVPANGDELRLGCWAEHEDGSLVFVCSTEDDKVVYEIFDMSKDPVVEYRSTMNVADFETLFSTKRDDVGRKIKVSVPSPKKGTTKLSVTKELWTWHDKTPFPWDRIMKSFDNVTRIADGGALVTAAERIVQDLKGRWAAVTRSSVAPNVDIAERSGASLGQRLGAAFNHLFPNL